MEIGTILMAKNVCTMNETECNMKLSLQQTTIDLLKKEFDSIPVKYHKPFNSTHEGLGVLREEYLELEQEIFFGEKKAIKEWADIQANQSNVKFNFNTEREEKEFCEEMGIGLHKERIRKEAVQVAAMAIRIIQELT